MAMDTTALERNQRLNAWLATLATREQVVGETADGTKLTIQVPTLGLSK